MKNIVLVCNNDFISRLRMKILAVLAAAAALFLFACYEPSPLYGKWADNYGNQITFISDGTFVAKIFTSDVDESAVTYQGDYSVIDNVLVFSVSDGNSINTEWDIRGSMLFLEWAVSENRTKQLTLYHVSK